MLNVQPQFPLDPSKPSLGDLCHQQQDGQVPVCVVTDLLGNIMLCNIPTTSSYWVVIRSRVNITRMWTSSTCLIKCVCNLPDPAMITPPLTSVEPFRPIDSSLDIKNKAKNIEVDDAIKNKRDEVRNGNVGINQLEKSRVLYPLGIGDEICVYLGYIDYIGQEITSDFLGKRLLRVFVGCIDIVTEVSSSTEGLSVTIECRDRLKYLTDSYSSFNPSELSSDFSAGVRSIATNQPDGFSRENLILAISRKAVGDYSFNTCGIANCGYRILDGIITNTSNTNNTTSNTMYTPDYFYTKDNPGNIITTTTNQNKELNYFPRFNIISTRAAYNSDQFEKSRPPTLVERVAIEYIKHLSLQESLHTEVFCHHVTGDFYYIPRLNDDTGLADQKRFYRTYYNRITPPGFSQLYDDKGNGQETEIIHPCQKVIVYREEQTLLSTRSNIYIKKLDANSTSESTQFSFSLKSVIPRLQNRSYPCSYFTIYDDSVSNAIDYVAVGLHYAKRVSKEVRACSIHLVGDPSLSPSEVIQVVTSSCNYSKTMSPANKTKKETIFTLKHSEILEQCYQDRKKYKDYYSSFKSLSQFLSEKLPTTNPLTNTSTDDDLRVNLADSNKADEIKKIMDATNFTVTKAESTQSLVDPNFLCEISPGMGSSVNTTVNTGSSDSSTQQQTNNINNVTFAQEPATIWRIEAINHRFNDGKPGFYSELALISPF